MGEPAFEESAGDSAPLLSIRNLRTHFETGAGTVRAVDGISYDLPAGKVLAVVGESGSGKSVHALSILRLLPHPPARIVSGEILFRGRDILRMSSQELQVLRGNRIAMIFQEPMTSLNPVLTIGDQIAEAVMLHKGAGREAARSRAVELLRQVGISEPAKRLDHYPHEFSGGMRQRVMIAIALSCSPDILIADEPTTALDVTIQAQILELLRELQKKYRMAVILITHNIGVVAETADEVAVMYAGRQVEYAEASEIFKTPKHPYTKALLNSVPSIGAPRERLETIPGQPPDLAQEFPGCPFEPRCSARIERCRREDPPRFELPGHRLSNCWHQEAEAIGTKNNPKQEPVATQTKS